MQQAVQALLAIEAQARAISVVQQRNPIYVQEETMLRINNLQQEMETSIALAERTLVDDMVARVKEIEAEYRIKGEGLSAYFYQDRQALLGRVVHEVLHGY